MQEIERKWILSQLPAACRDLKPLPYERYFLFAQDGIEIRIQKKGEAYEFERKVERGDLTRTGEKFAITAAEFDQLKQRAIAALQRQSYQLTENGVEISIKEYLGDHQGLIRAEVEFDSEAAAEAFIPPSWFGTEITTSPLGKDKHLMQLTGDNFQVLLDKYLHAKADILKVASLTLDDAGRLLIVKPKGKDVWISVGGKLEEGETEVEGVTREIREELNVGTVGEAKFYVATPIELAANTDNTTVIVKFYLLDLERDNLTPDGDEIAEFKWISAADFAQIKASNSIKIGSGLEYYAIPKLIKDGLMR